MSVLACHSLHSVHRLSSLPLIYAICMCVCVWCANVRGSIGKLYFKYYKIYGAKHQMGLGIVQRTPTQSNQFIFFFHFSGLSLCSFNNTFCGIYSCEKMFFILIRGHKCTFCGWSHRIDTIQLVLSHIPQRWSRWWWWWCRCTRNISKFNCGFGIDS